MENLRIRASLYNLINESLSPIKINDQYYRVCLPRSTGCERYGLNTNTRNMYRVFYNIGLNDGQLNDFYLDDNNTLHATPIGKTKETKVKVFKLFNLMGDGLTIYNSVPSRFGYEKVNDNNIKTKVINKLTEDVTNLFKSLNNKLDFDISSDVKHIYSLPISDKASDELRNSCMQLGSDCGCSMFSEAYNFIGEDKINIIYKLDDDGGLIFRALLWDVEIGGIKTKFLDRVYGNEVEYYQLTRWAKNKGYAHLVRGGGKMYQNESINDSITVKINDDEKFFNYCSTKGSPYFDTINLYYSDLGLLIGGKHLVDNGYKYYRLSNSSGGAFPDTGGDFCQNCGCFVKMGGLHQGHDGGYYCDCCIVEISFTCNDCGYLYCVNERLERDNDYYCVDCYDLILIEL